jgi:hypothetical protein
MTNGVRVQKAPGKRVVQAPKASVPDAPTEGAELVERNAFVPDKRYAQEYVHRTVDGVQDFQLLRYCMDHGVNLLLRGHTGSGKTMFPMAFAAEMGLAYYSIPCDVAVESSAFFGKWVPTGDPENPHAWMDGPVTELVRHGGVLNISEVNLMSPRITGFLYPLLDHRRSVTLLQHKGEIVRPHGSNCWCDLDALECRGKWLLIVSDCNPNYQGTQKMNKAFENRFGIKRDWDYDSSVEKELIQSPHLLDIVDQIRGNPKFRSPISTNSMMDFLQFAGDLGVEFAIRNFAGAFEDTERQSVHQLLDVARDELAADVNRIHGLKVNADLKPDEAWLDPAGSVNLSDYVIEKEV